jgi:hypothetical protein
MDDGMEDSLCFGLVWEGYLCARNFWSLVNAKGSCDLVNGERMRDFKKLGRTGRVNAK